MKLAVDTTLPPQQFYEALMKAAQKARAEHLYLRGRTEAYVAIGWDADTAREMALADLAIQQGALQ